MTHLSCFPKAASPSVTWMNARIESVQTTRLMGGIERRKNQGTFRKAAVGQAGLSCLEDGLKAVSCRQPQACEVGFD